MIIMIVVSSVIISIVIVIDGTVDGFPLGQCVVSLKDRCDRRSQLIRIKMLTVN